MQRAAILPSAASLIPPHYSRLSHKPHDFRKKKLLRIKCVFWFSLQRLLRTFVILRRIQRYCQNVKTSSCKVPILLSAFNFSKKVQISSFIKIRPVGAELVHTDRRERRTDITKQIVAFCNFANPPKKRNTVPYVEKIIPNHNLPRCFLRLNIFCHERLCLPRQIFLSRSRLSQACYMTCASCLASFQHPICNYTFWRLQIIKPLAISSILHPDFLMLYPKVLKHHSPF